MPLAGSLKGFFMKMWIKPLCLLVVLILFCIVISKVISGNQTLADYADKNPDIAYATICPIETQPPSPSAPCPIETQLPSLTAITSEPLYAESPESTHYQYGFYYQALSEELIAKMVGVSYPTPEENPAISLEELCYLNVLYYDFNGELQNGSLVCNQKITQDLVEIFYELYLNEYQIEKIKLIDDYNGDDTASMLDNNTSCFNYRVVDGTDHLSKHALGCAIDINPFYNPYVVYNIDGTGETYISPEGSEQYADRSLNFPYKIDENDLCYKLFKEHGFVWGGDWNSCKDYQHFQKVV